MYMHVYTHTHLLIVYIGKHSDQWESMGRGGKGGKQLKGKEDNGQKGGREGTKG